MKDNTETKTVKQFILILLAVVLIVIAIYLFTTKVVNKDSENTSTNNNTNTTYIDPTKAIVGTMLSNAINSKYIATDGKTNPTASKLSELRFGEVTLLKVKDNKITNAYESVESIKKELKITD